MTDWNDEIQKNPGYQTRREWKSQHRKKWLTEDAIMYVLITLGVVAFMLFAFTTEAHACSFDTDCQVGSTCVKPSGSLYGICIGGLSPGNANDRRPAEWFPDINGTVGDTCTFDTDCGPGYQCLKSGIYGACIPR